MHAQEMAEPTPQVGVLVLPGFSLLALGAIVESLAATSSSGGEPIRHCTLSVDGASVAAATGGQFAVDAAVNTAQSFIALLVCGGPRLDGEQESLRFWLKRQAAAGVHLGACGSGVELLARAGLLRGCRHVSPDADQAGLLPARRHERWQGDVCVVEDERSTSIDGLACVEMMRKLIEHAWCGVRDVDSAGTTPPMLGEVLALMRSNIAEPLPMQDLVRLCGFSRRRLEQLFRNQLDTTPARYYLDLRLTHGRRLLRRTGLQVGEVAVACGFVSIPHFSRSYRSRFGIAPRDERQPQFQTPISLQASSEHAQMSSQ